MGYQKKMHDQHMKQAQSMGTGYAGGFGVSDYAATSNQFAENAMNQQVKYQDQFKNFMKQS